MVTKEEGDKDEKRERYVASHRDLVGEHFLFAYCFTWLGNFFICLFFYLVWELLLHLSELLATAVVRQRDVAPLVVPELGDCDEHRVGEEDGKAGVVEDKVDTVPSILRLPGLLHCWKCAVISLHCYSGPRFVLSLKSARRSAGFEFHTSAEQAGTADIRKSAGVMGMVAVGADSDKKNTLSFAHLYSLLGYLERALFCKFLCVMNF